MNSAIAQFCLEVIAKHGDPAPRLCNKDPLTLKMGSYVIELFPNVSIVPMSVITFNLQPNKKFNYYLFCKINYCYLINSNKPYQITQSIT